MRTLSLEHFRNSREIEFLHKLGKARPVGPSRAGELQWLGTDPRQRVVRIGLVHKSTVRAA